jgi:hypothetical protein
VYNLENPPHEDIKTYLGWETKYPNKGAWKNFITRVVNHIRVEQSDRNRMVFNDEAGENVSRIHYCLVFHQGINSHRSSALNHQAKQPAAVPTREEANKKTDKKVSIYETEVLAKRGEIIDTYQDVSFGIPVILVQWRDIKQLCRVTIYIHLLSGCKASHLEFAISSGGNYFEFYYKWHEDFLDESKVIGCEKKLISMDDEGLSEAYFQKKNNYRAVSNAIQNGSD